MRFLADCHSAEASGRLEPMPVAAREHRFSHAAYAGLDFIKAAFCPLDFMVMPFREHPDWAHLGKEEGLARLEVGNTLRYPRQFRFTDLNGHRRTGTQITTSVFGLAQADFDLFL